MTPLQKEWLETALDRQNAHAAGMEEEKGRLQPGMLADLTVLSADGPQENTGLLNAKVLYTIVDEEIVDERE